MMIKKIKFQTSSARVDQCPEPVYPEFAFAGRSNVGKSSLINYLANRKHLAKTSAKPGKTLLINHFLADERYYLVDLPGYGYTKTGMKEREEMLSLIFDYIRKRENLVCLVLLLDARLEPLENDKLVINWLGTHGVPFVMAFTKTDKLNRSQLNKNIEHYKNEMLASWEELPRIFLTSSSKKTGRDELLLFFESVLSKD